FRVRHLRSGFRVKSTGTTLREEILRSETDEKKKNGSKERMRLIKVMGNEFVQDPCSMEHVCHPKKYAEEMGNRIVYEKAQNVRKNPGQAKKKPVEIFRELLTGHYDADNEAMEDEIKAAIRRTGYKSRRNVLSYSLRVSRSRLAESDNSTSEKSPEL
ncbi:hypothetical protein V3C99_004178, partial [Haemonchus contortus]